MKAPKRTKLADGYLKRKMATGGSFWSNVNDEDSITAGRVGSGLDLASGVTNGLINTDKFGVKSNAGAAIGGGLSGAAAGFKSAGVIGAGVGLVGGAALGLINNGKAKKARTKAIDGNTRLQMAMNAQRSDAAIAANPELVTGRRDASYYKLGGTMKGLGVTPPRLIKPIPKVQPSLDLMPNIAQVPGRQLSRKAKGGDITPLSSEDAKVTGPSHEAGGVKIPTMGVELEGGETVNNNFVFSKELGFAQKQEKVAKKLGKVEEMPDTPYNRNTAMALKRQTDMMKVQQESLKSAMGIPNELDTKAMGGIIGGPDDPKKPAVKKSLNNNMLVNGKLMVEKKDGSIGQWGNELTAPQPVVLPQLPVIQPSDKAVGLDNTYLTARNNRTTKTPDVIQRSSNYAAGGFLPDGPGTPKKKKTDTSPQFFGTSFGQIGNALKSGARSLINTMYGDGTQPAPVASPVTSPLAPPAKVLPTGKKPLVTSRGNNTPGTKKATVSTVKNERFPLLEQLSTPTDTSATGTPTTPVGPLAVPIVPDNIPGYYTPPVSASQPVSRKTSVLGKAGDIAGKVTPFLSNINNALTKLPLPPLPTMDDVVTPATVDYSASRAEAVRANRGANKAVDQGLNSGAASTAARAANLTQQVRAVGQINEAENNTNASIRNQANQLNAGIKASNNAKKDNYNNELVQRELKSQQLRSENIASVEQKIQGMSIDKKLFDMEDQKVMLEALKDDTGASFRGARDVFAKHLSKESLSNLDTHFTNLEKDNKEDRESAREAGKLQLAYLKRTTGKMADEDKTLSSVLGKIPTVTTAKDDDARNKARRKK